MIVRETSGSLTGLVKKIDRLLEAAPAKTPRAPGVFVIFDSKALGLEQQLLTLADKEGLKHVILCIGSVPPDYTVAPEADLTAVIYTLGRRGDQKVTANFALRKGELTQVKADGILKALGEVLPAK